MNSPTYKFWDVRKIGSNGKFNGPGPLCDEDRIKLFWGYVRKTETCWNWFGPMSKKSTVFCFNKKRGEANRFAWLITFGEIPEGRQIKRNCGNRLCVNPAHLFLSSASDRPPQTKEERIATFMTYFDKVESTGCWIWNKATKMSSDKNGSQWVYGAFCMNGEQIASHRASWILFRGDIPRGHFVCHKCDVTRCVNPDHLFTGTPKDNTTDMVQKHRHQHGERHGNAKLDREKVAQIKKLLAAGGGNIEIGNKFNVSDATIYGIAKGRTWRHV